MGNDIKLNNERSYWPIYDGEYIYYVKKVNEVNSIWRITVDGSEDIKIADYKVSTGMLLHNDKIYFADGDDSDRIYCIDKDGRNLRLIVQDKYCEGLQFVGNLLKYTTKSSKDGVATAIILCDEDGNNAFDFLKIR